MVCGRSPLPQTRRCRDSSQQAGAGGSSLRPGAFSHSSRGWRSADTKGERGGSAAPSVDSRLCPCGLQTEPHLEEGSARTQSGISGWAPPRLHRCPWYDDNRPCKRRHRRMADSCMRVEAPGGPAPPEPGARLEHCPHGLRRAQPCQQPGRGSGLQSWERIISVFLHCTLISPLHRAHPHLATRGCVQSPHSRRVDWNSRGTLSPAGPIPEAWTSPSARPV